MSCGEGVTCVVLLCMCIIAISDLLSVAFC